MRKKQVFAILLAGAMTAGTVPSAALAAENDIPAVSSEITEGENSGEIPQEEGQTPPAEPTQAPEATPEAPMETPVEPTEAPAVPETPAEPTQAPETETTPEATPSAAPETLEAETTGISITTIGENNQETITYYKTLQEAVDAVPTIESGAQEPTGDQDHRQPGPARNCFRFRKKSQYCCSSSGNHHSQRAERGWNSIQRKHVYSFRTEQ